MKRQYKLIDCPNCSGRGYIEVTVQGDEGPLILRIMCPTCDNTGSITVPTERRENMSEKLTEEDRAEGIKLIKMLKALDHPIRRMIVEFILNENAREVREKIIERDRELLKKLS